MIRRPAQRALRALATVTLITGIGISATACTPQHTWHPVTTEESQLLATTRFNNFDAGTREFVTTVTVQGAELALHGWYDFAEHIGYASVTGQGFEPQTLLWDEQYVALRTQSPDSDGLPPLDQSALSPALPVTPSTPAEAWNQRALDPSASALDALLVSFNLLGSDRPDNPLLLQQAGALFLGAEELTNAFTGPDTLQVFASPPSDEPLSADDERPTPESATVKFWLDDSALLHRTELLLGGSWATIDFSPESGPALTPLADQLAS